jgi:hypothetical protein
MAQMTTPQGFQLNDAGRRIVVDPVTRIEGHMRVEVNIDDNGVIRNAVSTGTMWRGLEVILKGRDPRDAWAFTERICGVCTGTHALTSVRAVEDALGIQIPENANTMCMTTWSISTTCTRSTGSMSFPHFLPIRRSLPRSRRRSLRGRFRRPVISAIFKRG